MARSTCSLSGLTAASRLACFARFCSYCSCTLSYCSMSGSAAFHWAASWASMSEIDGSAYAWVPLSASMASTPTTALSNRRITTCAGCRRAGRTGSTTPSLRLNHLTLGSCTCCFNNHADYVRINQVGDVGQRDGLAPSKCIHTSRSDLSCRQSWSSHDPEAADRGSRSSTLDTLDTFGS